MSWVMTAIGAGSALSAGASIYGANRAASTQQQAAQLASQTQLQMFEQGAGAVAGAQGAFSPYTDLGNYAASALKGNLTKLTAGFAPTMAQLEATPGYQFTLDQGLKATTNANSAMGLADSGVQGKGIANYAEGLASTTYQQQFQNYMQQQQQAYGMLAGPASLGAGAAGSILGGAESLLGGGINTGQGIGSNIMGGANASAAATMTGANAIGSLGTNAMNNYMQYAMLQRLGMFGPNATPNAAPASVMPSPAGSTLLGPISGDNYNVNIPTG